MAVRFEAAGDRLEIHQTRRGLRIATWLFVVFGLFGVVLVNLPQKAKLTITCSRTAGTCTIGHPHSKDWTQPLASITSVGLSNEVLELERRDAEPYHLCTAPHAENEAAATALGDFLKDPKVDSVATQCTTHLPAIPIVGRLAGVLGMALLYLLLTAFLVDAHTIVDRKAGTITMRGSSWPLKRWSVERPLSDVVNVAARRIYTGRGQHMYLVDVVFEDGAVVRAMSPAAYRLAVLQQRITELRRYVGLAAA
ncbi:MAG: hypothetical protein ABI678_06315 [Kofleriaceae bacterium]